MAKPHIILLHGWGSNVTKLTPLADELNKLGWKTTVPAYPYFDLEEPERAWSVSDFVNFIEKNHLSKLKNQSVVVFGHSFGGRVAIKLTSKLHKNIVGVVLCSAAGLSRDPMLKRVFFKYLSKALFPLKVFPNLYTLARRLLYKLSGNSDYMKLTSENKKMTFRLVIAENLKPFAKDIMFPTLVLWGKKDKLTPIKDAYWLKNNLHNVDLHVFSDIGHTLPYEKPHELATIIDTWYTHIT